MYKGIKMSFIKPMNDHSGVQDIKMSFIKPMNDNSGVRRHQDIIHKAHE
ncbi:hypothetical protein [Bacillus sp. FJAT-18017]|nr:hypothetical protein [Bacillus sp. FJAT-18017]